MVEYSIVGTSVPRVDALEKVTGRVKFCSDVRMHGMLYGKVLRSPHAHARIIGIDTAKAEALPGVRAVITGKDAPAKRCGAMRYAFDQHVLARVEVLYVGEGVAAVAADTLEIAEKAVKLIEVPERLNTVLSAAAVISATFPDVFADLPITDRPAD